MAIETDRASARCRVSTSGGDVFAERVVVATDVPIGERSAIRAKLTAYRSYAIAARARRPLGALLWDLASPYHHARTARIGNREFLIAGGGDHRVGEDIDTRQVLAELDEFARSHFGPLEVTHHWSGQIIETADGLPYVGAESADDARVLFATGLSGNGITSGTLAGLLLADLVRGHANPWARLLAPDRARSLASVGRNVGRNLAAAKRRLTGRIKELVTDVDQLPSSAGHAPAPPGRAAGDLPQRHRRVARAGRGLPQRARSRSLERRREELGLPVVRQPLRSRRRRAQRPRRARPVAASVPEGRAMPHPLPPRHPPADLRAVPRRQAAP